MSQQRREKQAERLAIPFRRRIILTAHKRWKQVAAFLTLSEILKLLQEHVRIRFVDWALGQLGSFGAWIAGFHFAFLVVAVIIAIFVLVATAVRESYTSEDSLIVDSKGTPYKIQVVPTRWGWWFSVASVICGLFIAYGAYDYYRTIPLLDKYPLGYVIFDTDYVTNAVTPFETRRGLEAYQFDFRPVRITQDTKDRIAIRLPDLIKDKKLMATGIETGGWKRVGNLGGAYIGDDKGAVFEWAEILAIKDSEITFVVGFQRGAPLPH